MSIEYVVSVIAIYLGEFKICNRKVHYVEEAARMLRTKGSEQTNYYVAQIRKIIT